MYNTLFLFHVWLHFRWILVRETDGEVLHTPQIEEVGKVEAIDEGEGSVEEGTVEEGTEEDNRPVDGTFHFNRCQYVAVYIKSGNASGNKVEDSGNNVPQIIRMSCFLFSCDFCAH